MEIIKKPVRALPTPRQPSGGIFTASSDVCTTTESCLRDRRTSTIAAARKPVRAGYCNGASTSVWSYHYNVNAQFMG